MATTASALLAAVRADPDADLPRLVYADHLDDAGDAERAEFIRVQCELARLAEWDDRRPPLEDREHELLDRHENEWLNGLGDRLTEWEWRRGFVDEVSGSFSNLRAQGVGGFAGHPVRGLNCLTWRDAPDLPAGPWAEPWLAAVRRLSLADTDSGPDVLQRFLGSPHLAAVTTLDVGSNPGLNRLADVLLGASCLGGLQVLTAAERCYDSASESDERIDAGRLARVLTASRLERLRLSMSGLFTDGLHTLLAASPDHLRELDVSNNELDADVWQAFRRLSPGTKLDRLNVSQTGIASLRLGQLLGCPALHGLTGLDVSECMGPPAAAAISRSPYWQRAEQLWLRSCWLEPQGLTELTRRDATGVLRLLHLGDNRLGRPGLEVLCGAGWANSLTWLQLGHNDLGDEAMNLLRASGRLTNLRTLHLNSDPVTDAGASVLAAAPSLARLRILNLSHTQITDNVIPTLIDAPYWQLSGIGLAGCDLTVLAVHALATSRRLHRLQWLDLSGNPDLGGDTLMPLAESPHLSRLCELDIGGVDASDRVRDALRQRLGRRLSD